MYQKWDTLSFYLSNWLNWTICIVNFDADKMRKIGIYFYLYFLKKISIWVYIVVGKVNSYCINFLLLYNITTHFVAQNTSVLAHSVNRAEIHGWCAWILCLESYRVEIRMFARATVLPWGSVKLTSWQNLFPS